MRAIDIDYIYGRLKNQKMTEPIRPGDTDEAYYQCGWNNALCRVDMILAGTPILDVEPVRHGRWVKRFCHPMRDGEWQYICSACKDDDYWNKNVCIQEHNYCPNCGAKMDLPNQ